MRLIQNRSEDGGTTKFSVSVIPDERQFEPRPFAPADVPALLAESRALIPNGDSLSTEPALFGPQLRLINPVRVEVYHGALVLWMGGSVGYAIVPDSEGCPAMNRAMTSATEQKYIYRLERF